MKNTEKKADTEQKRNSSRQPVQLVVEREFMGTKSVSEIFIPIILDDIQKKTAP